MNKPVEQSAGSPVEATPEAMEGAGYRRGAERLANEVDRLVQRGIISSRSPAADALLDFRDGSVGCSEPQTFEEWWFAYDEVDQELPSRYEAARAAWKAALSTQKASAEGDGWISVEKELPPNEDMVQTFGHTERSPKSSVNEWRQEVGRYLNNRFWTNSHIYVTHWQPPPAPPVVQEGTER